MKRCSWAEGDAQMEAYHDGEWGVPERNSRALWEKLILDGFQAGLAWITVLRKRDAFREAFVGFQPEVIATWGEPEVLRLLENPGIIRSRAKIEATIGNAKAYLTMRDQGEDFAEFLWGFVDGKPSLGDGKVVPAATELSEQVSKELKKRGFKFVGPTIVYAFLQAVGIVNDHLDDCPRRAVCIEFA